MVQLENFPFVGQLFSSTSDGLPDENASENCVPSSICAGLRYLTGDNSLNPDFIKDSVLGQGTTWPHGTDASWFVSFCAGRGVSLYSVNGTPDDLVRRAHQEITQGHPVIFTEPDPLPDFAGAWHVCVFCGEDANAGTLTAMDPLGGVTDKNVTPTDFATRSDADWAGLIQATISQIWIMELTGGPGGRVIGGDTVTIDITNSVVAFYFTETPDGKWQCKQTGFEIQLGMLKFYRSYGNNAYCGLTYLGLPKSNEIQINGQPAGVVKQLFERGCLVYDPQHHFDSPPGAGDEYLMHLEQI